MWGALPLSIARRSVRRRIGRINTEASAPALVWNSKVRWPLLLHFWGPPSHIRHFADAGIDGMNYPHLLRQYHAFFALRKMKIYLPQFETGLTTPISQRPVVLSLDGWQKTWHTVQDYPRFKLASSHHSDHYFNGRIRKLWDGYIRGGAASGVRLVETRYRFGDQEVYCMIKIQRRSPGEAYHLISTVARLVCVPFFIT